MQHELFNDMYLVIETGYDGWPGAMGTATPKVDAEGVSSFRTSPSGR